ncbi:MAG: hypothetical protein JXR77_01120 [Lentisphaeria bacterium]|nr:hypothetical protein [Lentisphaeria bacterium]
MAGIAKVSQRRWHQYERDQERESPILTGLRYLRLFEQESVTTYARAASILGVSRQRVYQLVSLVTRIPTPIMDYLVSNEDPAIDRFFTERRLRPLTVLPGDEAKYSLFVSMLGEIGLPPASIPASFGPQLPTRVEPPSVATDSRAAT